MTKPAAVFLQILGVLLFLPAALIFAFQPGVALVLGLLGVMLVYVGGQEIRKRINGPSQ